MILVNKPKTRFLLPAKSDHTVKTSLQAPPQADGSVPLYVPLTLDMLSDTDGNVIQLLAGAIQSKSCIVCSMVVALQVPRIGYVAVSLC